MNTVMVQGFSMGAGAAAGGYHPIMTSSHPVNFKQLYLGQKLTNFDKFSPNCSTDSQLTNDVLQEGYHSVKWHFRKAKSEGEAGFEM